ncbi:MAG: hypothetical protein UH850_00275 [Paludibacteraceae bacterium]|nr:hypothetical protein [Paludibacteraceae bacterium]
MKQDLNREQTAKLIELGFKKPESIIDVWPHETDIDMEYVYEYSYSIGELLSFLPLTIQWTPRVIKGNAIEYSFETEGSELYYCNAHNELIDNLFDMCIKLKEEEII